MKLRIATRSSPLARWQAEQVASLLVQAEPGISIEYVPVQTAPDRDLSQPIAAFGGKGAFCKGVQRELLEGRADIAVHSAKDMQSLPPEGLVIGAYPERGAVHDCLVGATRDQLGPDSIVATGSARRWALMHDLCPGVNRQDLRGNIARRLSVLDGDVDAIVMAAAALERLGLEPAVVDHLDPEHFVPQVGQGAMAVETREDNPEVRRLLATIDHPATRITVEAERDFLRELGGDCDLPAGAYARLEADGKIVIRGVLVVDDVLRRCELVDVPETNPGRLLAERLAQPF